MCCNENEANKSHRSSLYGDDIPYQIDDIWNVNQVIEVECILEFQQVDVEEVDE